MAAALQATAAPRVVGRYVLYGEIASGGMATVHFGRLIGPAGFARPVAIKRLHAQFARDPDFVKMFFDEARLAARIAHPNVVPTLDVVSADDEVFLVMDYVRGTSLAQLVRTARRNGERIAPLIAVGVVSGMLQGLHAAHEAKNDRGERLDLVHRDVSPQNVLVGTDGIPRLLDFGVAKASGRLQTTRDGQLKGKLAYMAPEQVRGEPLTRRTDIYAASVVLWEVLTGKRLFYAESEATVLSRVLTGEVLGPSVVVPEVPQPLDRVVLRGLERDPARRYATAREMAADLETCIGVASATEIGDWVERTAADELRERACHIAEIERTAAETADPMTQVAVIPGSGAPDAPTPVGKRARDLSTRVWANSQTTRNERPPVEPSRISSLSSEPAIATPRNAPRNRVWAIVGVLGGVVLLACLLAFARARFHAPAAAEATRAQAGSGSLAAAIEPQITRISPDIASTERRTAIAPALPGVAAPALAKPGSVGSPALSPAAPRAARGAAPGAIMNEPARADPAECNPPYTADSKGHIHFKPNCM